MGPTSPSRQDWSGGNPSSRCICVEPVNFPYSPSRCGFVVGSSLLQLVSPIRHACSAPLALAVEWLVKNGDQRVPDHYTDRPLRLQQEGCSSTSCLVSLASVSEPVSTGSFVQTTHRVPIAKRSSASLFGNPNPFPLTRSPEG
jgi:hypothetical protein